MLGSLYEYYNINYYCIVVQTSLCIITYYKHIITYTYIMINYDKIDIIYVFAILIINNASLMV